MRCLGRRATTSNADIWRLTKLPSTPLPTSRFSTVPSRRPSVPRRRTTTIASQGCYRLEGQSLVQDHYVFPRGVCGWRCHLAALLQGSGRDRGVREVHLSYGPKRQGVSHRITPGRYPRLCCGEHAVSRHPLLQLRLVRRRAHFPGRPLRQDLRCAIYEVAGVTPRVLKAYCPVYDEVWEATTGTTKLDAY